MATPLYLAAFCGHVDIVKLLINYDADVLLSNKVSVSICPCYVHKNVLKEAFCMFANKLLLALKVICSLYQLQYLLIPSKMICLLVCLFVLLACKDRIETNLNV